MTIDGLPGGGGSLGIALSGLPGPKTWIDLFTGNWRGFLQTWLDPFDLWFDKIFSGRPKVGIHSATDSVALFLIPAANPVLSLWGIGIRLLEGQGIPLSVSGGAGQVEYRKLAAGVLTDLQKQFGPAKGANQWETIGSLVLHCQNPASNRRCIADRIAFLDSPYNLAILDGELDPHTGFKPHCPKGFHFDKKTEACVKDVPIHCPAGFHLLDGVCVVDVVTSHHCPPGSHKDAKGQCVPDAIIQHANCPCDKNKLDIQWRRF